MKKHLFKNKTLLFLTITITIISSALSVLLAFVLKNILDLLSIKADANEFYRTIFLSGFFIVFSNIVYVVKKYVKAIYIKKVVIDLKNHTFNNISNLNIAKFKSKNSGNYVSNLTNDIKLIEDNYLDNLVEIFDDIVSFIIAVLALIKLNIYLAAVTALISTIPLLIPKFTHRKIALLKQEYSNSFESFTARIKDIFTGFEVIKSFNIHKQVFDEFNKESNSVEKAKYRNIVFEGAVNSIATFCSYGVQIITITVGVYLALKNMITIGTILAAGQLMNYIVSPIAQVSARINAIKSSKPIIEKLEALSVHETEPSENITKEDFNEKIIFSDVSFSYDNKVNVLDTLNFEIEKGKKYAFVGHSGSGKSTILRLLLNYYNNYSGEILMDGIKISDIKPESLYKLVSIIHQNVFIFDTTIKENITLYQQYAEDKIKEVIQLSGLSQLISTFENKENTYIGEAGNKLSGGEKQRIGIARALIRNTPLLLLDEATASLDNTMAYNIEKSILNLKNITALVITHKLSQKLLKQYDSILVMKNGILVEKGSFQQLMDHKEYFYSLYYNESDELKKNCAVNS
ncbi:MAG: ABC transporter ATP-binding protein [Halanaerobiales bacterium]|nr:ABC transporter ATP-binding protein [Halanaerobiales bacterium]